MKVKMVLSGLLQGGKSCLPKLSLVLLGMCVLVSSVTAHAPGVELTALTSTPPTIDGNMSPGEWDDADTVDFILLGPGTPTRPEILHTLYVMNDTDNLYLAVKRYDESPGTAGDWVTFVFDNDNDGMIEDGDDRISIKVTSGDPLPGAFSDMFYSGAIPVTDAGWQYEGTTDGSGAAGVDGTYIIFELSHPLDSGDTGWIDWQQTKTGPHDFSLSPGDTVGFDVSSYDGSFDLGMWPAQHPSVWDPCWAGGFGDIIIAGTAPPAPIDVGIDIKPTSCPNPFNMKSRGVLPVAILGTEELDVADVDPALVRLEGVAPLRSSFEDVAAPITDREECECTEEGPDGYTDLVLKFERQEIAAAIGPVDDRDMLPLTLEGQLVGGLQIVGVDCVVILKKGRP